MNGKNNNRTSRAKLQAEACAKTQPSAAPAERHESVQGDELLTKQELAARLKVTVRTVENWQQEGLLPYLKISNTIRFYWPDVVAQLSGKLVTQPSGATRARWGARKESASSTGNGGGR